MQHQPARTKQLRNSDFSSATYGGAASTGPPILAFPPTEELAETIFCEIKLGVEQLLGAEAEVNLVGFSLRFQLFATEFETRQAPPLLMQPVRARHAFR